MRIKQIAPNVILLSLSLIMGLFIVEIAVRQANHQQYQINSLFVITNYSTFAYKPNTNIKFEGPEFKTDLKINSKGLRDYEYDYDKNAGVKRILMVGDSMIAALQVPLENSISKKLENLLNMNSNKNLKYEVLNMGVSGYGPTAEALFLENEGIKYNPDIVILNLYVGNDVTKIDFGVSGRVPIDIFEGKSLKDTNVEVTKVQRLKNFIARNYFTYSYFKDVFKKILYKGAEDISYLEFNIYKKNYTPEMEKNLEKLKTILNHIRHYTEEKNIKLLVALVPTKEQVDKRKFSEMIDKYKLNESDLEIEKLQKILLKFGNENNITIINLLPELSKRDKNNDLYFEMDGHWNAKGQELAANLIYKKLINEKFINR